MKRELGIAIGVLVFIIILIVVLTFLLKSSPFYRCEPIRPSDNVALVTGGSRGIGYSFAKWLKQKGFVVVITGRKKKVLQSVSAELGVHYVVCDSTNESQVNRLVQFMQQWDRLTLLINNAGDRRGEKRGESLRNRLSYEFNLNTISHWVLTKKLLHRLKGGHVLNIGSHQGIYRAALASWGENTERHLDYVLTKNALHLMSNALSAKHKETKINAACILMKTSSKNEYASEEAMDYLDSQFSWILENDLPSGILFVPSNVKRHTSMQTIKTTSMKVGKFTIEII